MAQIKALKPGDTIGIAAPSSPFDRAKFTKGVHILEKLGFKVFFRKDIFDQNRYLAGTDKRRAEELTELMSNRAISAIMFARGGYGSQRIIPLLNASEISKHPKPVIGFSDITPLLAFLRQSCNVPTFYGPVLTQLGSAKTSVTSEALFNALTTTGPIKNLPMGTSKTLISGSAKGGIVGGCLAMINSSMGTPYELKIDSSILFIEEVKEKVYVIDRMLTQLKNSGTFDKVNGIIFGAILPPEDEPYEVESMISDVLADFKGPVVYGFPAGHCDEFVTLPLGAEIELSANEGSPPQIEYKTGLLF